MPSKLIVAVVSGFIGYKLGQLQRDGIGLIDKLVEIGKMAVDDVDQPSGVVVVPGEVSDEYEIGTVPRQVFDEARETLGDDKDFIKERYLALFGEDVRD